MAVPFEQAEAARALVAACGDNIHLSDADDSQLLALGPVLAGSVIRRLYLVGSFSTEGLTEMKRVAAANGHTVKRATPNLFWADA